MIDTSKIVDMMDSKTIVRIIKMVIMEADKVVERGFMVADTIHHLANIIMSTEIKMILSRNANFLKNNLCEQQEAVVIKDGQG